MEGGLCEVRGEMEGGCKVRWREGEVRGNRVRVEGGWGCARQGGESRSCMGELDLVWIEVLCLLFCVGAEESQCVDFCQQTGHERFHVSSRDIPTS